MSSKLLCVKNKNTLSHVAEQYMLYVGASTNRNESGGLSGQGLGTKFVGIRSAVDGRIFGRASWDQEGAYLAWYETEEYDKGDSTTGTRAVLVVKRPESGVTRTPMTVDTNLVESGWSQHLLGDAYPTIREVIIDAVDEDPDFRIDQCDEMSYAPEGETWTFVEQTKDLAAIMRVPTYYFRRGDEISWIGDNVGVAPLSSMNEAQIYVTAGDDPRLAYVCWSSGREKGQEVPDAAFDYVLKERPGATWVSMPKRLLENVYNAHREIIKAICWTDDGDVMTTVLRNVLNGGWEAEFDWPTASYSWNRPTLAFALGQITGGRPIHYAEDLLFMTAKASGHSPIVLPPWMYKVGKELCNLTTVHGLLNVREDGEVIVRSPDADERNRLLEAFAWLKKHMPWQDWRSGHVFMVMETDDDSDITGLHLKDREVIAINLGHEQADTARGVAKAIIHEYAHHKEGRDSSTNNFHSEYFADLLVELMMPPS